jgi:hypothetical protein
MAYKDEIANIAQEMHYGQAVPLLDKMKPQWASVLGGKADLRATPEYRYGAKNIDLQTGRMNTDAVRGILGTTPVGGQQTFNIGQAVGGTGTVRAGGQGDLLADILGQRRAEPTGFATGAPGAAMSGLSGLAQNQIMKEQFEKQQEQDFWLTVGSIFGGGLLDGIKG